MAEVLVVDDDPDIRLLVTFALEDAGHTVRQVADGNAALLAMQDGVPDAMVMDVMMPALDGFGVLRSLREHGLVPGIRVLLLTCKTDERDHRLGYQMGAVDYLTKPFDPEHLTARVDHMLAVTDEELEAHRCEEMERAQLLDRLEAAFNRKHNLIHG